MSVSSWVFLAVQCLRTYALYGRNPRIALLTCGAGLTVLAVSFVNFEFLFKDDKALTHC